MTDLFIFNQKISSLFQLLGEKENNISYSVGYAFSQCPLFLQQFLQEVGIDAPFEPARIKIKLQRHERNGGFTDFEILQEGVFHVIVEAKRGWVFPGLTQMQKYSARFAASATQQRLVVFNESTPAYARAHFTYADVLPVKPQVVSWKRLQDLAKRSISKGQIVSNQILRQLFIYLSDISTMQNTDSNRVFVVSLGGSNADGWKISWQDIVNREHKYFHPVGGGPGGWPKEPPNYIAFRYNGRLQTIHHIDSYEVTDDLHAHFPEIPAGKWDPHYLYHLGTAIRPPHEIRTGKQIFRNGRVWAAFDLLLTCKTIGEARDRTSQRG